jgi:hypothetical protein
MAIFLFEPDYIQNGTSDRTENLWVDAGLDGASKLSVRMSWSPKWGVGGPLRPHCHISERRSPRFVKINEILCFTIIHLF